MYLTAYSSAKSPSSVVDICVKHDTSQPLRKDPCIGRIKVEVNKLIRYCDNDQGQFRICNISSRDLTNYADVSLDLETAEGRRGGVISIKLEQFDRHKIGSIVVKHAADDVKRVEASSMPYASQFGQVMASDPSAFINSLSAVVSKLNLFVTLVDEAAKVIMRLCLTYFYRLISLIGTSICQFRLAGSIVFVQGP
jgi:hypothetical protein